MRLSRIGRFFVATAALVFAVVGLGFWVAPVETAAGLGLESSGPAGLVALRADLGGLFLGMALLCGAGLWTARRAWMTGAAVLLGIIAFGRLIGWAANGAADGGVLSLAVELVAIGGIVLATRASKPMTEASAAPKRRRRWAIAGAIVVAIVGTGAGLFAFNSSV